MASLVDTHDRNGKRVWLVRYEQERGEDGKRRRRTKQFRTRREALDELARHGGSTPTTATVSQLLDRWMREHVTTKANGTIEFYESKRVHIDRYLGGRVADDLTVRELAAWQQHLLDDGLQSPTVNGALRTLRACIRWCRGKGATTCRSVDDITPLPQPAPKPAQPYTPNEVATMARAAPSSAGAALIMLAAYTGLRWGELAALTWPNVDLPGQSLLVMQAIDRDEASLKPPKSVTPRDVPILEPALPIMLQHRSDTQHEGNLIVFPSPLTGSWMKHNDWMREVCKPVRRATGIHLTAHQLRDTFASLLIASDIGEIETGMYVGHKSTQTTRQRYAAQLRGRTPIVAGAANETIRKLLADPS